MLRWAPMTFQTNALNFTLFGRLGGTGRNPRFSRDVTSPFYVKPDKQNLYDFELEEMGVLDLSLVPGATTIGIRFVNWIWIRGPLALAPGPAATISIVDSISLKTMRLVASVLPGPTSNIVYYDRGVQLPQGASIRFEGDWLGTATQPVRLRVGLTPAADNLQWAASKMAACCKEGVSFLSTEGPRPPVS